MSKRKLEKNVLEQTKEKRITMKKNTENNKKKEQVQRVNVILVLCGDKFITSILLH